jgi:hypothetical protein
MPKNVSKRNIKDVRAVGVVLGGVVYDVEL